MITVGLIGRPNVGKSSLFNALVQRRRAIVYDQPGTTMDQLLEQVSWYQKLLWVFDTQGIDSEADEPVLDRALETLDVGLFVVDGRAGLLPMDRWLAKKLHQSGKKILLVINKAEDGIDDDIEEELDSLGFKERRYTSATQRQEIVPIKQWCLAEMQSALPEELPVCDFSVAIIGKPNAGKSTLMNQLCGKEISNTSPKPLTTRDTVSYLLDTAVGKVQLFDTAGMRRPSRKKTNIELFSIKVAQKAVRSSDVVLLVVASHETVSDQDMRLLALLNREGKPAIVLLNFWDRLDKIERKRFVENSDFYQILKKYKMIPISAMTGFGVKEVLAQAAQMYRQSAKRVKTAKLNEVVKKMVAANPPPMAGNGNFNILYASQVDTQPPTFVLFLNRKGNLPDSYKRYLENNLKSRLGLNGQSIRIHFRHRDDR